MAAASRSGTALSLSGRRVHAWQGGLVGERRADVLRALVRHDAEVAPLPLREGMDSAVVVLTDVRPGKTVCKAWGELKNLRLVRTAWLFDSVAAGVQLPTYEYEFASWRPYAVCGSPLLGPDPAEGGVTPRKPSDVVDPDGTAVDASPDFINTYVRRVLGDDWEAEWAHPACLITARDIELAYEDKEAWEKTPPVSASACEKFEHQELGRALFAPSAVQMRRERGSSGHVFASPAPDSTVRAIAASPAAPIAQAAADNKCPERPVKRALEAKDDAAASDDVKRQCSSA
jgi:hypothetical protein